MGRSKELKKIRKYMRQQGEVVSKQFHNDLKIEEYLRDCPQFIPKFVWNKLLSFVIKK